MRITALLALLAASAVLAACGSGSSYGGGSSTASSSSSGSAGAGTAPSGVVASAKKAKVGSVIVDARVARFTASRRRPRAFPSARARASGPGRPPSPARASGLPKHVATVRRPDGGKLQLTYDGHPLYRYAGDASKADANGEGVGGQWFVLKAGGAARRRRPPAASA